MNDMTITEAFEKAGHPVPGELVVFRTWTDVCETYNPWTGTKGIGTEERSCWECYAHKEHDSLIVEYVFRENGWSRDRYCRAIPQSATAINLSNLLAKDAYDALPTVVQNVVMKRNGDD